MNRSVHCISAGSRVRLLIYLLVHHLRMHTHGSVTSGYDRRFDKRDDPPSLISKPEHREGKLILPWREDEAFRLRALANNRASSRSSWVTVGIRSMDPLCRFLDRVKTPFPAGFVESAIVTADRKSETRAARPHVDLSCSLRTSTTEFALIYARPQIKREIESFSFRRVRVSTFASAAASYTRSCAPITVSITDAFFLRGQQLRSSI